MGCTKAASPKQQISLTWRTRQLFCHSSLQALQQEIAVRCICADMWDMLLCGGAGAGVQTINRKKLLPKDNQIARSPIEFSAMDAVSQSVLLY